MQAGISDDKTPCLVSHGTNSVCVHFFFLVKVEQSVLAVSLCLLADCLIIVDTHTHTHTTEEEAKPSSSQNSARSMQTVIGAAFQQAELSEINIFPVRRGLSRRS